MPSILSAVERLDNFFFESSELDVESELAERKDSVPYSATSDSNVFESILLDSVDPSEVSSVPCPVWKRSFLSWSKCVLACESLGTVDPYSSRSLFKASSACCMIFAIRATRRVKQGGCYCFTASEMTC